MWLTDHICSCMNKINTVIYSETGIVLKSTVIQIFGHTAQYYALAQQLFSNNNKENSFVVYLELLF